MNPAPIMAPRASDPMNTMGSWDLGFPKIAEEIEHAIGDDGGEERKKNEHQYQVRFFKEVV